MKTRDFIATFSLAAALSLGGSSGTALAAGAPTHSGSRMSDGTVYVDVSPDTHKSMYTTVADAPGLYRWKEARNYCRALRENRHHDWRVPTRLELNLLFWNRAAIGEFDESGGETNGWYWSSTPVGDKWGAKRIASSQRFSDGFYTGSDKQIPSSLRCVR